jgi:hypothetical protein
VGKVFDGFGVWEFDCSGDLESHLCNHKKLDDPTKAEELYPDYAPAIARLKQIDAQESFLTDHLIATRTICENTSFSRAEKINAYIATMQALGITVKYKPLRQFEK